MTDNRTNGQIVEKALVAHCEDHKMPFPRGSIKKIVEALRVAGRLAGEPTEAQVEAAAKVLAPDGVFAEDFGEYSRKRDNYRREDQAEEQRYYMRKARAALAAADAHLPSVEQVKAEAWKEGYVAGFLKAMGGELDGSARAAVRLLTGFTDAELDELGGFEEEKK